MTITVGSLCSGYGGLDLAVEAVFGAETAWFSEIEPAPASVFSAHWDAPNLHDLTTTDFAAVDPVDILTAGYPCQPFSHAGKRQGTDDERHLWPHIADAIGVLRPRYVVLENVAGHLSLGFDVVLADLAALGFDAEWTVLRASEVGACHGRARLFALAADARGSGRPEAASRAPGEEGSERSGRDDHVPNRDDQAVRRYGRVVKQAAANTYDLGRERGGSARGRGRRPADSGVAAADATGDKGRISDRDGRSAADSHRGGFEVGVQLDSDAAPDAADRSTRGRHVDGCGSDAPHTDCSRPQGAEPTEGHVLPSWGDYGPAIERHERLVGRPAPSPTDDRGRLSPLFEEWMMCLPEGWVTDVLTSRTKALKCLGNGVVPPQAAYALRVLAARLAEREAVA